MRRPTLVLCLAFLAVVAVVASAAAGTQVPIKGSLSTFLPTNVTMVSCGVPGVSVPGSVGATGTISHLGGLTMSSTRRVARSTRPGCW